MEAAVERRGWRVVAEFCDNGISGANGRDKRPAFDRLHKAITRREFDVVAAWSVDRLGRSLQDLVAFLGELHGASVDLYLDRQGVAAPGQGADPVTEPITAGIPGRAKGTRSFSRGPSANAAAPAASQRARSPRCRRDARYLSLLRTDS